MQAALAQHENKTINKLIESLSGSKEHTDIQKVVKQYMLLMALCAVDDEVRKEFEAEPHKVLKEHVPLMKIPDDAVIVLDNVNPTFPTLTCISDDKKIILEEKALTINEKDYSSSGVLPMGTRVYKRSDFNDPNKIDIHVDMPKDCRKIVVLPYYSYEKDLLTEYKFAGETEVVLSCAS